MKIAARFSVVRAEKVGVADEEALLVSWCQSAGLDRLALIQPVHVAAYVEALQRRYAARLVVWTLLDTGLRVSEFSSLCRDNVEWQRHRLMVYGKGGPYGSKSKRRIIPLTARVQPLIEGHFSLHEVLGMGPRTIQRIVKRVANCARISRPVSPHVLRHTFAVTAG